MGFIPASKHQAYTKNFKILISEPYSGYLQDIEICFPLHSVLRIFDRELSLGGP